MIFQNVRKAISVHADCAVALVKTEDEPELLEEMEELALMTTGEMKPHKGGDLQLFAGKVR